MRGKHFERFRWTGKRIVSAILSAVVLFTGLGFSTYAWLTSHHEPVVNEFTGSKLVIDLTPDADQGPYKLVPGVTYNLTNDAPIITVKKGSVECYLFVVVHETDLIQNTTATYYGSTLDGNLWDYSTVPYGLDEVDSCTRSTVIVPKNNPEGLGIVAANPNEDQTFQALNAISVRDSLTKTQVHSDYFVNGGKGGTQPVPKVVISAYSIQTLGFKGTTDSPENDLKAAWAVVQKAIKDNNTKEVVLS